MRGCARDDKQAVVRRLSEKQALRLAALTQDDTQEKLPVASYRLSEKQKQIPRSARDDKSNGRRHTPEGVLGRRERAIGSRHRRKGTLLLLLAAQNLEDAVEVFE